jgi:predicted dehydrogenase
MGRGNSLLRPAIGSFTMQPVRLAMIGAGNVAESYVRQIRRLREEGLAVELAAICSRGGESARRLASTFGIAECGVDVAATLARKDIDAVIVLTPMQDHAGHVRQALSSGKHVLSEKTFATTAAEGRALAGLAVSRGLRLCAAPFTALSPVFHDALRRLERGDVGQVLCCRALYGWHGPDWADWFHKPGAGALRDLGVYALTTLTGLLGPVESVLARESNGDPEGPRGAMQLSLSFAVGCIGTVTTGFGLQKYRTSGIEVYGSEGTLQFVGQDWDPKGLEVWTTASGCWQLYEAASAWPWTDGVRDFCQSIIRSQPPESRIDHVLHVLEIVDQALASLRTGRSEEVISRFENLKAQEIADMPASHLTHNPLTLS